MNNIKFLVVLAVVFFAMDFIVTSGLRKSKAEIYHTLNKIMDGDLDADIIINGSSKAFVQVSPIILDTLLNQNSYNLGMDGNEFLPQLLQYQLYKKYNKKPDLVIQIVGNDLLQKKKELFGFMRFAPILTEDGVMEVTKQYEGFTFLDYHLPFIRYSGYFGLTVDGILSNFGIHLRKDANYKGFHERDIPWDNSFDKFRKANPNGIDIELNQYFKIKFKEYVSQTKDEKIPIILVYPPTYAPSQKLINNKEEILDYYIKVSEQIGVPFLDYSEHMISKDVSNFYNSQHLNKKGAEKFTSMLSEDIQNLNILEK